MMRLKLLVGIIALIAAGAAVTVFAQVSGSYDLSWHVIGAGGGERASASFRVQDTAGQPAVGRSQGTAVELIAGFWAIAAPPPVTITPTPTSTATATRTPTRTPTPTFTATATSTNTPTRTPTVTQTATATPTTTPTPTGTPPRRISVIYLPIVLKHKIIGVDAPALAYAVGVSEGTSATESALNLSPGPSAVHRVLLRWVWPRAMPMPDRFRVYRRSDTETERLLAEVGRITDPATFEATLGLEPGLWARLQSEFNVRTASAFHALMISNTLAAELLSNTHFPVALVLGKGYLDRDIVAGQRYTYRVEAVLTTGEARPVDQASVTTGALVPLPAPTSLTTTSVVTDGLPSAVDDWAGAQRRRRANRRIYLRWTVPVPSTQSDWPDAFTAAYDVWRREFFGVTWTRLTTDPVIPMPAQPYTTTEASFYFVDSDPDLRYDTPYCYRVTPRDLLGQTRAPTSLSASNEVCARPPDYMPPPAPANLQATVPPSNDRVVLTWGITATEPLTFTVYKTLVLTATVTTPCSDLSRCWKAIGTTTGLSFTDTDVAFDTPYWYRVQAQDSAGNLGPLSEPVSAIIHDHTPPDPPEEMEGTSDAFPEGEWVPARLRLWPADPSDVASYLIWRQFQGDPEPVMVDAIPSTGDETVYTSTLRLPFSQTVTYTVQAVDAHGNVSQPSAPVTVSQGLPIVEAPPKPIITDIFTEEGGDYGWTAEIQWQALDVPGLSQFQVYRFPEPGSVIAVVGPGENFALDRTVQPGILYTYAVVAIRETESGPLDAWSEPVQYKVLARRGRALSQFTLTAWLDPHGAPAYLKWNDITTTVVPQGRRYLVFRSIYPDRGFVQLTPPITETLDIRYVDYVDTDADQPYWYVVLRLNPVTREVEAYAGPVQATPPTGSSAAARPAESLPRLRYQDFRLSQLPATLLFGGDFQMQVTSYDPGATLSDLSGYGSLVLFVEGEQRVVESIRFEHLQVELIDPQTARVTAGSVPVTTGLPIAVDLRPDGFAYQLTELTLYPVGIVPQGTIRLQLPPSLRWVERGVRRSTVDLTAVVSPTLDFQGGLFLPPQDCVSPNVYLRMETLPWRVVPSRFDATPTEIQLGSVCTVYDERFSGFPTPDDPYRNDGLLNPWHMVGATLGYTSTIDTRITANGLDGTFTTDDLVFYTAAYPYGFQVTVTAVVPSTTYRVRLELEGSRIVDGWTGPGNVSFAYYRTPVGPGTPDAPDRFITADFVGLAIGDGGWLYGEVTTSDEIRWNGFRLRPTDGTYELYIPPIQTADLPQGDAVGDWSANANVQPGLNVRTAMATVDFGWWPCTDPATEPPLDLGGTPVVDIYLRRGGVSDTVEVRNLPPGGVPLDLYGYDVTLTSFGFSFYDNHEYDSNTNGELFLGGPSRVDLPLNGMITDANGCVIRAQPGAANVILDYWQVMLNLDGVEFRDEPSAPGGKLLWLLGSLAVPHVGPLGSDDPTAMTPVPLEASFNPDGTFHRFNLIQTAVHFTLDGFDWVLEGIRLSNWSTRPEFRERPSWDPAANLASPPVCFPLDPFDPDSPCVYRHGFVEMVGKMAVPFFGTVRQADDDPTLKLQVMVKENYVGFVKRPKAERQWTVVTDIKFGYDLVYAHHHEAVHHRAIFTGFRKDDIKVLKVDSALVLDPRLPEGQGLSTVYLGLSSGVAALRGLAELTQPTLPVTLTASLSETMQTAWFPKLAGQDGPPDAKYLDLVATVWPTITVAGGYTQTTQVLNSLGASIPDEPSGGETLVFTDTARMWKIRGQVSFDPLRDASGFIKDYELGELRVTLKFRYQGKPAATPTPTPTPGPTPTATPPRPFFEAEQIDFIVTRQRDFILKGLDIKTNLFSRQINADVTILINPTAGNERFEGGLKLRQLQLEAVYFNEVGAALGIGRDIYYLGATGDAVITGTKGVAYSVGGSFLFGRIDDKSKIVLSTTGFADLIAHLGEIGEDTLTGFYVRAYGDFPLYNKGCVLQVNAGGEVAVWFFVDRVDEAAYGGKIRGYIYGKVLCVVSARGDLTLILSKPRGGTFQFDGTLWLAGGIGWCEPETWKSWETRWWDDSWCYCCGASIRLTYNTKVPNDWDADYQAECE